MGSGSAGTLLVTVGAQTGNLASSLKQGEDSVRRFRRTVETEADAVRRSTSRIGSGFEMSTGQIGRSARSAVAGLALLTQSADGAAGGIARLAGNIVTGFAVGGPAGAAIAGLAEGFGLIAQRIRRSRDEAEALRQSIAAANLKRVVDEAAAGVAAARASFDRSMALSSFMGSNARDASRAGMTEEQRRAADDAESVDAARAKFGPYGAASRRDALDRVRLAEEGRRQADNREREGDRRRAAESAINRELGDRERLLRIQARLGEDGARWARDYLQIQDLIAAGDTKRAAQLRGIVDAERAAAKAAQDAEEAKAAAKRRSEAQQSMQEETGRRLRDLQATTELQRLLNRQADELRALEKQGLDVADRRRTLAYEVALFQKREADDKARAAESAERLARAEADAAQAVRYRADQDRQASEASARASQAQATVASYAGGYGPLAQARDAKRRSRAIERGKRHAANLAAEARESMGYGTMGATQYDENGNPVSVGFNRPPKAPAEVFPYAAPGTFNPAYFGANPSVPNIGGGAGGGGGPTAGGGAVTTPSEPALKAAADALTGASGKSSDASNKVSESAGEIAGAAETIGTAAKQVSDDVSSINGSVGVIEIAFGAIADEVASLRERMDAWEATASASGYYGA